MIILIIIFFFFQKIQQKMNPKSKGNRKKEYNDTKTEITQVLIELQQKFFHQHWAQK